MAKRIIPAAKLLHELLHYNPKTGKFSYLKRGRGRWRDTVGYIRPDGYVAIHFEGRPRLAHMLAWLWMTGRWPKKDIDHRNRKRSDNRWSNLRETTRSVNCRNNKLNGRAGVGWDAYSRSWKVYIWRAKVGNIHIGRYKTKNRAMRIAKLLQGLDDTPMYSNRGKIKHS